jgi:hypothetical protein
MKLLKYPNGATVEVRDEDVPATVARIARDHGVAVTIVEAPKAEKPAPKAKAEK